MIKKGINGSSVKNMNCCDYEMVVYDYYKNKGYEIQDVTFLSAYWDKDIDFILTLKSGKKRTIEVKTDSWIGRTNNVCIELKHFYYDSDKVKKGWFYYCEADSIYYCDSLNNLCYVINMDRLADYVISTWNSPDWNIKYSHDKHKKTKCLLLSLDELYEADCITRVIEFQANMKGEKQ